MSQLPFFYIPDDASGQEITLGEDTSRHVIQVLRMKTGEQLNLTDGQGQLITASITFEHKKHCKVVVVNRSNEPEVQPRTSIAISLLKNPSRFEWFLEKATEIGVREIIPLLTSRTEKEKFRADRMQTICISAMLQSRQCWLPVLYQPLSLDQVIHEASQPLKFIAHCEDRPRERLWQQDRSQDMLLLIGPEGDFTTAEIDQALDAGFIPVTLGNTRLRTETAGISGALQLSLR
ncbi:RsmE family RNA methyltransferase [Terrimonas ferruginea]|uniref:RsmE family RNA methyltransferase n=1 Tax=Terrimonas ferruginea TaxID=249 RepID=UPI0003F7E321|nr:RsmE family RNA methyltransferase [Terrimonas ferruginea]